MPVDWIDIIHKARMNNKPHTEEAKAKMRASHSKAISEAKKKAFAKERLEQESRNEINRIKVAEYLKTVLAGSSKQGV